MHVDYLRLVAPGRMYTGMTHPPRFSDRDRKLAAEASAALRDEIVERGWSLPPADFRVRVGTAGYDHVRWCAVYLSASDGTSWTKEHGFGFRNKRPGDVTDAEAFSDIFKLHGLT